MSRFLRSTPSPRPRVVVAGGGVGGVEAALALRDLCGDAPAIELVSPEPDFVYRAMTVAEPFGFASTVRVPYERLEHSHAIHHRRGAIAYVDSERQVIGLENDEELAYNALVVAVGARPEPWLPNALTFSGPPSVDAMRGLLAELDSGAVSEIVFAAPAQATWTLPLYELALLTTAWCAERAIAAPRLHVVTPEADPLELFGTAAVRTIRELLADRGITLHAGARVTAFEGGHVTLSRGGRLEADAVVALPRLVGNAVRGLPVDPTGFVLVDDYGRVSGVPHVYAVGDATTHPIKQGGLAAQQADVAAAAIAAALGSAVKPRPFTPVLRGMLLTGVTSAFLRTGEGPDASAFSALWWPPSKVAGRYIAAYLTDLHALGDAPVLVDNPPPGDVEAAARDRGEMRALALEMANADAGWGEYDSAIRWLQTIEWLDGVLPADLARLRDAWGLKAKQRAHNSPVV